MWFFVLLSRSYFISSLVNFPIFGSSESKLEKKLQRDVTQGVYAASIHAGTINRRMSRLTLNLSIAFIYTHRHAARALFSRRYEGPQRDEKRRFREHCGSRTFAAREWEKTRRVERERERERKDGKKNVFRKPEPGATRRRVSGLSQRAHQLYTTSGEIRTLVRCSEQFRHRKKMELVGWV